MKAVIAIAVVVLLGVGVLAWRTMHDDDKPTATPTKRQPTPAAPTPEPAEDDPTAKALAKPAAKDPNHTPFDDGTIGRGLVGCGLLAKAEGKCPKPIPETEKTCRELVEFRTAYVACAAETTVVLQCMWHGSQSCAAEDACASEVGAAYDCMCKLPKHPDSCK